MTQFIVPIEVTRRIMVFSSYLVIIWLRSNNLFFILKIHKLHLCMYNEVNTCNLIVCTITLQDYACMHAV